MKESLDGKSGPPFQGLEVRKWKRVAAGVSLLFMLGLLLQYAWYRTHPRYVGIAIPGEETHCADPYPEDGTEEKFKQMAHVLRYLVNEVKKHGAAIENISSMTGETGSIDTTSIETEGTRSYKQAVIVSEEANIRPAPSLASTPIMTLSRGTELLVDYQQNEWNRVLTPTGKHAWISSSVLEFRDNETFHN